MINRQWLYSVLFHLQKRVIKGNKSASYRWWVRLYDTLTKQDRVLIKSRIEAFANKPLISIIMPVYNTPEKGLVRAIESVLKQLYPHWELCLADDASTQSQVKKILDKYIQQDSRIKIIYRTVNGGITATSNDALSLATGAFVGFLEHDDELAEHALYRVVEEVNRYPEVAVLYSDEDKITEKGKRYAPYFKSDWNPDLFYGHNFISHFGVYRRSLLSAIGAFREGYDGSQDYDLALRAIEKISFSQIRHIPEVLYHRRGIMGAFALGESEKPHAHRAAKKAIQSHLDHIEKIPTQVISNPLQDGSFRVLYSLSTSLPLITIIIPTKDKLTFLQRCIESILTKTEYSHFEIIVVDNQSTEKAVFNFYEQLRSDSRFRCLDYHFPFNFSKINNFAAHHARGEHFVFLNNDTEIISSNWLSELVSHSQRKEIGLVGAKLYYPNDTIQHAGVICGMEGCAGHIHVTLPKQESGYMGKANLIQNFLAVTGACMMIRRNVFEELQGFDENLAGDFNDVDLCLRAYQKGYRIIWTPYAELYHHESATRGYEIRDKKEADYMRMKWDPLLQCDPFYNPNLCLYDANCALAFPPRVQKIWHQNKQ